MTYDPSARRDTPLALSLKTQIARHGPMGIDEYMSACLVDDIHGYYRTFAAIGVQGDFITAPEISQVFGELIGLWCVAVWQQMGHPKTFNLIELGPGRGTLMADILRASRLRANFAAGAKIRLIETNPKLRAEQRRRLADGDGDVTWHDALLKVSGNDQTGFETNLSFEPLPTLLIANEFLDTRPIKQFIRSSGAWYERTVEVNYAGLLRFSHRDHSARGVGTFMSLSKDVRDGDIVEKSDAFGDLTVPLKDIAQRFPLATLFVDYGHVNSGVGDTLQAVRNHKFEHPLTSPGEADLSAQVDFEQFERQMVDAGFVIDGPVPQAEFLGALGIAERASVLMSANLKRAAQIEADIARLMAPNGMGTRFKVLGVRSSNLAPLPGLAPLDTASDGA